MYDLIKSLAAQLLMLLPVSLGLAIIGLVLLGRQYRRSGWSFTRDPTTILGVAILALASWGPVAERLLVPLETHYPARDRYQRKPALMRW